MRNSEVFENFLKLAEERGLISPDAPDKAKKILESNPRMDSLDAAAISKLYGLKPDAPKDMQYKKNIVDIAHPEPVVVSPSYDKLNGLVENINERQNILLHIVNKNNDGLSTQHKYAEKDLILSLVRIGNDLDNQNKDDLRVLADACLFQVSEKPIKKLGALPALLLNPVTGIAALFGALYVQQHINFVDEGFEQNHKKLIAELDDFLNSNTNFGVGVQYKPEFISVVTDFKNKLEAFYSLYEKAVPTITEMETPKTVQETVQAAQKADVRPAIQSYSALKAAAKNLMPYIQSVLRNFSSESYKARQVQEKGILTSLVDKTQFLHGGQGLVADDFDDVKRAIPPYLKSLGEVSTVLQTASRYQDQLQEQLTEASQKTDEVFSEHKTMPASAVADVDQKAGDLESDLANLGV